MIIHSGKNCIFAAALKSRKRRKAVLWFQNRQNSSYTKHRNSSYGGLLYCVYMSVCRRLESHGGQLTFLPL